MYTAVIVAAGKGTRSNLGFNKVFYNFGGKSLIDFTLLPFENDLECDKIILVVSSHDFSEMNEKVFSEKVMLVLGGATRQESVMNGLHQVSSDITIIHDGARPNLHPLLLNKCIDEVKKHKAITLGIPVKDTLKTVEHQLLGNTVPRENTVSLQTPQAFFTEDIIRAHKLAFNNHHEYTDDATLYKEELHQDVYVVMGDEYNIKATTQVDLMILEEILCTK
ncbi:MAG: 2-C-methyl-D-erythritol 4-phosphate cytidylyltransferase [Candidatus Izemoplasmatales bacterium]